jgi:hypothetical protein
MIYIFILFIVFYNLKLLYWSLDWHRDGSLRGSLDCHRGGSMSGSLDWHGDGSMSGNLDWYTDGYHSFCQSKLPLIDPSLCQYKLPLIDTSLCQSKLPLIGPSLCQSKFPLSDNILPDLLFLSKWFILYYLFLCTVCTIAIYWIIWISANDYCYCYNRFFQTKHECCWQKCFPQFYQSVRGVAIMDFILLRETTQFSMHTLAAWEYNS